jgi:exportin-T
MIGMFLFNHANMLNRGMRSANPIIRSRATFLFLKIVKSLQSNLHPYVENLYQYLKEFLPIDIDQIEAILETKSKGATHDGEKGLDDKLFLYEAMGNILASDKISPAIRNQVLEQMLQPTLAQMDHILANRLYTHDTDVKPVFATVLAHQISAIAYLSKGFGRSGQHLQEARQIFKRILVHNIVAISSALPNNALVAEKVILYLHRMIALLGDEDVLELFPVIVSQLFSAVQPNEQVQLRDIVILVNQLITKYGQKSAALMNDLLMPLVGKLFVMIDHGNYEQNIQSEEIRQKVELHKTYFLLLNSILAADVGNILTTPKNVNNLNQILETIVQGCNHRSQHVVRLCFGTLHAIVKRYTMQQPTEFNQLPNFTKYVHERVVSSCFSVPLRPDFDLVDGINNQTLMEITQLLQALATRGQHTAEFMQFLTHSLLPQLKLSTHDIQLISSQLQTADDKTMKKVLKQLFMNLTQQQ